MVRPAGTWPRGVGKKGMKDPLAFRKLWREQGVALGQVSLKNPHTKQQRKGNASHETDREEGGTKKGGKRSFCDHRADHQLCAAKVEGTKLTRPRRPGRTLQERAGYRTITLADNR